MGRAKEHIYRQGRDTLSKIARKYEVTVEQLKRWNHIKDVKKLYTGQRIIVRLSMTPDEVRVQAEGKISGDVYRSEHPNSKHQQHQLIVQQERIVEEEQIKQKEEEERKKKEFLEKARMMKIRDGGGVVPVDEVEHHDGDGDVGAGAFFNNCLDD